jgi:hypothetical protein
MKSTSLEHWIAFPGLSGAAHPERAALLRGRGRAVMLAAHVS